MTESNNPACNYKTKCGCEFTNIHFRNGKVKGFNVEYCEICLKKNEELERLIEGLEKVEEEMKENVE